MRQPRRVADIQRSRSGVLRIGGLGLAILAVVLGYNWHDVRAAPFTDPVEELRLALREDRKSTDKDEAAVQNKFRASNLEKRAAAITSVGDLAQALMLQEWRDLGSDAEVRLIDGRIREELADRFEKETRRLLKSGDAMERMAAANLLAKAAAKARTLQQQGALISARVAQLAPEVASLTKVYDPRDPQRAERVRLIGAQALGEIKGDPATVVPALKELIANDSRPDPRRMAAAALVNIVRVVGQGDIRLSLTGERLPGEAGQFDLRRKDLVNVGTRVVEAASVGVDDRDREVRRQSAEAILQTAVVLADQILPPRDVISPPPGRPWTKEEEENVKRHQTRIKEERDELMPLLDALQRATPSLSKAANDPDPAIRVLVFDALEQMATVRDKLLRIEATIPRQDSLPGAPEGQGAVGAHDRGGILLVQAPDKKEVKPDPVGRVKLPQDPLLKGLTASETWAALRAGLNDPDPRVRLSAVEVLEMMGINAEPAVPDLTRRLADPDLFTRWAAARTLGRIGPTDHPGTVEGLARIVEGDRDLDARLAAVLALQRYGPAGREGVPALRFALRTGDADLRIRSIRALDAIGTDARSAVPELAEALDHQDVRVRRAAVDSLVNFGPILPGSPGAEAAIRELREALEDPDPEVSLKASEALLRIPPPPAESIPRPKEVSG